MARRRKKKEATDSSSGGGWITTFADLMSLLLTFFILLYSMSSVSLEKFQEASNSIQSAFNGGDSVIEGSTVTDTETEPSEDSIAVPSEDTVDPELVKMYDQVVQFLEKKDMTAQASVEYDQDGIYVNIQESILFGSGSAIIADSGINTLNNLGELVQQFENDVVIEGYTDNVPMNNANFSSNWELSTSRALSVLRYLSEERSVTPTRLSAKGYGEYHPSVPNNSDENRAKNRRVNIVLVYDQQEE